MSGSFLRGVRAAAVLTAVVALASCGDSESDAEPAAEQSTTTEQETEADTSTSPEDAVAEAEFIAVGLGNDDESLVYVSKDGSEWVEVAEIGQLGVPTLAVGEDRTLAFALNDRGFPGPMWISEDSGLTWEEVPPLEINISSVGFLEGAFYATAAAIDASPGIYRSTDGTSWELEYEITQTSGNIFEGPPGLRLFPQTPFDVGRSLGSTDGTTWTEDPLTLPDDATQSTMQYGTYAQDGSTWWSIARGAQVFSSDDGIEWEAAGGLPVNFEAGGLAIADDVFVTTLNNGLVYSSSDGIEWERVAGAPGLKDVEPIRP